MGNPHPWTDALVRRGWLLIMTGAELKVALAIGIFFDRVPKDARADAQTLQALTGLSHGAFYEARKFYIEQGLLKAVEGKRRGKYRDYRTTVYKPVLPMPPAPTTRPAGRTGTHDDSPPQRKNQSSPADKTVRPGGQSFRETPRQSRRSSPSPTKESTRLEGRKRTHILGPGTAFVREFFSEQFGKELSGELVEEFERAALVVAKAPEQVEAVAEALARHCQAEGMPVWTSQVWDLLLRGAGLQVEGTAAVITETTTPDITLADVERVLGAVEVIYDGPAPCPTCAARSGGDG